MCVRVCGVTAHGEVVLRLALARLGGVVLVSLRLHVCRRSRGPENDSLEGGEVSRARCSSYAHPWRLERMACFDVWGGGRGARTSIRYRELVIRAGTWG